MLLNKREEMPSSSIQIDLLTFDWMMDPNISQFMNCSLPFAEMAKFFFTYGTSFYMNGM